MPTVAFVPFVIVPDLAQTRTAIEQRVMGGIAAMMHPLAAASFKLKGKGG
jgi:hypothetical protein